MARTQVSAKITADLVADADVLAADTGITRTDVLEHALREYFKTNPVDDLMRKRVARAEQLRRERMEKMGFAGESSPLRTPPTAAEAPALLRAA